jgi:DNA-binding response OmpR family regulator
MAKVLLLEPDRLLANIYSQALSRAGHTVNIASTAQEAIDAASNISPDIVILEVQLVDHSGIEFLYEFRSYTDWKMVPTIILSNVPPIEFRQSIGLLKRQFGVQSYNYKPATSLKKLLQIVEEANAISS